MAGVGRRTLYRKSVTDDYLNGTPEPQENEEIARMQAPRGSNVIEIVLASGEQALAILPTRFRKLIWVKRGDYLITSTAAGDFETSTGGAGKVRHRVEHILTKDQIKHLRKKNLWPKGEHNDFGVAAAGPITGKGPRENWGIAAAAAEGKTDITKLPAESRRSTGPEGAVREKVEEAVEVTRGCTDDELEGDEEEDDMSDLFVNNNHLAMRQLRTNHDEDSSSGSDGSC